MPIFRTPNSSDEYYTPFYAAKLLLPFLPRRAVIWESAWGTGRLAKHLARLRCRVVGGPDINFFQRVPFDYDIIVTNPPYSKKDAFLRHAFSLGHPFAFLLPLETLGSKVRNGLFRQYDIQVLVPSKRILFSGPRGKDLALFTAWFCWQLDLPSQLTFVASKW